jgi:tRNA(fMet)-specific endonuclease VapC
MKRVLDTDTCIDLINSDRPQVLARLQRFHPMNIAVSSLTVAELAWGVAKSGSPRNRTALESFIASFTVMPFDGNAAFVYGDLRARLQRAGKPIGPIDMLIAAHALSLDMTLVTNNEREFRRVPDLRIENWVAG